MIKEGGPNELGSDCDSIDFSQKNSLAFSGRSRSGYWIPKRLQKSEVAKLKVLAREKFNEEQHMGIALGTFKDPDTIMSTTEQSILQAKF